MKYLGEFTRLPGLVFDTATADGESIFVDTPAKLPEAAYYVGSVDWGGSDPTACLIGLMDTRDCLWIIWEHYKAKEDILQTLKLLTNWHDAFHKQTGTEVKRIWCDHRLENIKAMRSLGLSAKAAKKGPNSIPIGISIMQARMRTGRLKILKDYCPNLIRELGTYRYPTEDGETVSNKPIDKDNHAIDACRYLCMGVDRKEVAKQLKPEIHKSYE